MDAGGTITERASRSPPHRRSRLILWTAFHRPGAAVWPAASPSAADAPVIVTEATVPRRSRPHPGGAAAARGGWWWARILPIPVGPRPRRAKGAANGISLEIIGAGFGRTGTLSLKVALERLGFAPCLHMTSVIVDTDRARPWNEAAARKARGEPIDWPRVLGRHRATVDWPGAFFWRELAAAYPEAKVVLSVRDPDRWYDSARDTIHGLHRLATASPPTAVPFALAQTLVPGARDLLRMSEAVIWHGTFDGRFADRAHAIGVFERHLAEVQAGIPPERLLVFDVAQGWEPLCAFLGVDVPVGVPFPHANDRDTFRRKLRWGLAAGVAASLLAGTLAAAGAASLRRVAPRRRRPVSAPRRPRTTRSSALGRAPIPTATLTRLARRLRPRRATPTRVRIPAVAPRQHHRT